MISMTQALISLRPNAEFSWSNDDLSTLVWHTEGVTTPTLKQIKDEIKRLELVLKAQLDAKAAAKASAIAKLEALGLNLDEAQAIIGQ
jgi:hypothetical protein